MLKEYLSEAVSLLAEAVLGKSNSAGAGGCWYEYGTCSDCGADKKKRWLCCWIIPGWAKECQQWGCVYC